MSGYSLENFIGDLYECGNESQEGFFESLKEGSKSLWKKIKEIWSNFLNWFKRFLTKINPFLSKQEKDFRCSKPDWDQSEIMKMRGEEIAESNFEVVSVSEEATNFHVTVKGVRPNDDAYWVTNNDMYYNHKGNGNVEISIASSRVKAFLMSIAKTIEIMNKKTKSALSRSISDPNQGFFKKVLSHIKAFISTITIPIKLIHSICTTRIHKGKAPK